MCDFFFFKSIVYEISILSLQLIYLCKMDCDSVYQENVYLSVLTH